MGSWRHGAHQKTPDRIIRRGWASAGMVMQVKGDLDVSTRLKAWSMPLPVAEKDQLGATLHRGKSVGCQ